VLRVNASATDWAGAIDRLRPFVARRVPAADVDDVVQDVLVRAHRSLGAVRDDQRFAPWLYAVARTAIADRGRARARADRAWEPPHSAEEDPIEARLAGVIAFFVARLPSPYREAITLTELEGKTQREAAAMLGVSLPALKSHVLRGRARLRAMLEQCCEIALDARKRPVACTPRAPRSAEQLVCDAPADAAVADDHRRCADLRDHAREDRDAGG
jgi:RNA polymerase sigma-70 factor (ECF subfamily)